MKILLLILVIVFVGLQARLWVGDGSFAHVAQLNTEIDKQNRINQRLIEDNELLAAEVAALKNGYEGIEERARVQMGMIKEGETFYMIIDEEPN